MPALWFTGVASLILFAGIVWYLAPLEPNVLALQFAFTPRSFGEVVHFWSAGQLQRFRDHLPADFMLLASYGLFGYLLGTRTRFFQGLPTALQRWAVGALPLAALLDAVEDGLHWWLTEIPRFGMPLPYLAAASCASLKWLLLVAYALTALVAYARSDD
jgi:hypothetical protein